MRRFAEVMLARYYRETPNVAQLMARGEALLRVLRVLPGFRPWEYLLDSDPGPLDAEEP